MALATPTTELTPTPEWAWGDFMAWFRSTWEQGQHVTMIGPTGKGKTTLGLHILPLRRYIVALCVKGRDDTMEKVIRRMGLWRQQHFVPEVSDRIALWPKVRGGGRDYSHEQEQEFRDALNTIFRMGGWCVFADEVSYLSDNLGLDAELKFLLQQGRSSYITIVGATQRPAFIPLAFYDGATHLFVWRDNDHRNLKRVGELAGTASRLVQQEVAELRDYEVLYLNRDTGFRVRTIVEEMK